LSLACKEITHTHIYICVCVRVCTKSKTFAD